ncbi:MAG: recombination mediator RecR [Patescibacteria group bacterium]
MHSPTIQKLIDLFSKFPTVGSRTASRFVFYLLGLKKEEVRELLNSIADIRNKVKICPSCFNPFEPFDATQGKSDVCLICSDPRRNKSLLCVVANETDLEAIEKTKKYKGFYFIFEKLRIKELEKKLKEHPEIEEIILAMNSTTEGEVATLYLQRLLEPFKKKTTRLGRGLPVGGELEYADEETLSSALEGRK